MNAMETQTLEQQTKGKHSDFEWFFDGASQNQIKKYNIDEKFRRAVDCTVLTVENRTHDTILTAIDNVVIPTFRIAVKWITGLSGHGQFGEV